MILQSGQYELIMHPRLIDLVDKKWERFSRRIFFQRFLLTLVYMFIFLITTILEQSRTEIVRALCQKDIPRLNVLFDCRQKVKVMKWW